MIITLFVNELDNFVSWILHKKSRIFGLLIITNIVAWYPALNFWFFRGWEQSWLIGICGYTFDLVCLMKSHGLLYLLNYKLFAWNPTGWYATAILLHTVATILSYIVVEKLTKNRGIALVSSLIFAVNVAHNDVVNWGSFEGLYALLLSVYLLTVLIYRQAILTRGIRSVALYVLSIFLFLFGLFNREASLILPFFLLLIELFMISFRLSRSTIARIVLRLLPFVIISIGYLFFRQWYGGAPHDFIDAMVQLRIGLLSQGYYTEYVWRGLLSFTKYAGAHVLPYPIGNLLREILLNVISDPSRQTLVTFYFLPSLGVLTVVMELFLLWKYRKEKTLFSILLFSFGWFLVPTIFFSFAFTITDDVLARAYDWNASRWRYFAFFGTVIFWVTIFGKQVFLSRKRQLNNLMMRLPIVLFLVYLFFQFVLLRGIQRDMYKNVFQPEKDFFQKFTRFFPTLPRQYVFYTYPYASELNDFIFEWYFLRRVYYPALIDSRVDWAESHMGMLLKRFIDGTAKLEDTYFLDRSPTGGLLNRTEEARTTIRQQKIQQYRVGQTISGGRVAINLVPAIPVEIPYVFEVTFSGDVVAKESSLISKLFRYAHDRRDFLDRASVKVCKTAPMGSNGDAAMHLLASQLIDGNLGRRSFWAADCRPAWIKIDLGRAKSIGGVLWHGNKNGPNLPASYKVSVSLDGSSWQDVLTVAHNTDYQRIDAFDKPITARYVRYNVSQTTQGAMLMLDGLEVVGEEAMDEVTVYGNDVEKLVNDSYQTLPSVRFNWETKPAVFEETERIRENAIVKFLGEGVARQTLVFSPNEGEFYSTSGQFLRRNITRLNVDLFGSDSGIVVESVKIIPRFPLPQQL